MKRIVRILSAEPFRVTCEWSDGEIRETDLSEKLREWAQEDGSVFKKLLDETAFSQVQIDPVAKTLSWANLLKMKDIDGNEVDAPLEICPDVLYDLSRPAHSALRKSA
ncbi:MAG TPA: hypothetical protein VEC36_11485 [Patescibacteria group bacterium]|nr:hypothetical protein [Patescibacteria group bacterium]